MKPKRTRASRGFTLMELMIVVAILGILAAIAVPKWISLIRTSNEGATKGDLGTIRSALSIYYGDNEGQYPQDPLALTISGKYLSAIPPAKMEPYHPDSSAIVLGDPATNVHDVGGWIFDNNPADVTYGSVFVDCTDTDTRGSVWTSY